MIFRIVGLSFALLASAQEPAAFYKKNCAACHSIGRGRLAGPDLKGVSDRKDRPWLVRFMLDPKAVVQSGDAYAAAMVKDYRGMVMPPSKDMTPALAGQLLDWIAAQSTQTASNQAAEPARPVLPSGPEDIERGRKLFSGEIALAKGGAACLSCHSVDGLGVFGGGRLGPDLNGVAARMGGSKSVAAWLGALATPVMKPAYERHPLQPAEAAALAAYLDTRSDGGATPRVAAALKFVLAGAAGMLCALLLFDTAWRKRFRAVREPLVAAEIRRGEK